MNLREYAEGAEKKVVWETFGSGARAFEVQLRLCSKSELQEAATKFTTKVLDRTPDRSQRNWKETADLPRWRKWLIESPCVLGWRDLTFGKAVDLCNLQRPNGAKAEWAEKSVPFDRDSLEMLLQEALGFEDFVLDTISRNAAEQALSQADQEAAEKKVSASTPAASTAT